MEHNSTKPAGANGGLRQGNSGKNEPAELNRQSSKTQADTRPTYVVTLRPEPHCPDATRALRRLLKLALRRFGLRATSVEERSE
ncbi:MAG: hypothetical protein GEU95_00790 [Rhizobiales bacterium]|nr:hypothetical protein [Hyphomicrobiales bacterium]